MAPILQAVAEKFNCQAYIFYDDMIVLAPLRETVLKAGTWLRKKLTSFNFNINEAKSTPEPVTKVDWLGTLIEMDPNDPTAMAIYNTPEKRSSIQQQATLLSPSKNKG